MQHEFPPGATLTATGCHFVLWSAQAHAVTLELYAPDARTRTASIPLTRGPNQLFHVELAGIQAGQLYGYRVAGPFDPAGGHRFNPARLLLDPYGRAVVEPAAPLGHAQGYPPGQPGADLVRAEQDNGACAPKSVVLAAGPPQPRRAFPAQPVIYELHVKGFSRTDPLAGAAAGTFAGILPRIPYLQKLGVNVVELMPIFDCHHTDRLRALGLTDYWGYHPRAPFALRAEFGSGAYPGCEVAEFRALVAALHQAGIAVLLDLVVTHSGEGDEHGPTFCLRGIDNASYYALGGPAEFPYRHYLNPTGCGNALNFAAPAPRRLVLDLLAYLHGELGVAGFRFDLAPGLGRVNGSFTATAPLFAELAAAPELASCVLIAEPWDFGTYAAGQFPPPWREWSDQLRDGARRFWLQAGAPAELRAPLQAPAPRVVNCICCHDGFTLTDLVSYPAKQNAANGEANRDGADQNWSHAFGAVGPSGDPVVRAAREQAVRNLLATLFLAAGTPLLTAGDEFGRSQGGNNNAYCQDNPVSWLDWSRADLNRQRFVAGLIALRQAHPDWLTALPDATPCTAPAGGLALHHHPTGYLLLLNPGPATRFELPAPGPWRLLLDTSSPEPLAGRAVATDLELGPASTLFLQRQPD